MRGSPTQNAARSAPWVFLFLIGSIATSVAQSPSPSNAHKGPPADAPEAWKEFIGEYNGPEKRNLTVYENGGKLCFSATQMQPLEAGRISRESVSFATNGAQSPAVAHVIRDPDGKITTIEIAGETFARRELPNGERATLLVKPVRPVEELRNEALVATPPREDSTFRKPDLAELAPLDPAIHLDIRYATSNDFLGTPVYTQARAFLQRPAAESLVRALHRLQQQGYGLLIHDAYRPWYVTKIFWDATPSEGKIFVADPAQGSRHNRGCAVDLTMYDLRTGKPIEMPGTYDEMSPRSYPNYIGGTSLQRWHRDLLRQAMEAQGFTVYEYEWWHFDYKEWREYPILNIPFEKLGVAMKSSRN